MGSQLSFSGVKELGRLFRACLEGARDDGRVRERHARSGVVLLGWKRTNIKVEQLILAHMMSSACMDSILTNSHGNPCSLTTLWALHVCHTVCALYTSTDRSVSKYVRPKMSGGLSKLSNCRDFTFAPPGQFSTRVKTMDRSLISLSSRPTCY